MSKLTPEQVEAAAKQVGIPDDLRNRLFEMLADMVAPEDGEEKPAPVKKQFCILLSDPAGSLPDLDLVGWVVQIPEADSPATVESRIANAAHVFNATKRGRLLPVQTIGEACEVVPAKIAKECGVWVKTRTPVLVMRTRNEIKGTPGVLWDGERGEYRSRGSNVVKLHKDGMRAEGVA